MVFSGFLMLKLIILIEDKTDKNKLQLIGNIKIN